MKKGTANSPGKPDTAHSASANRTSNRSSSTSPIRKPPSETFVPRRIHRVLEEEQRRLRSSIHLGLGSSPLRGWGRVGRLTQGWRPGLHSFAASRLALGRAMPQGAPCTRLDRRGPVCQANGLLLTRFLRRLALPARTHIPQKLPRIDPQLMPVVPFELQRVLANRLC
jgi:hypothetical protein